MTDLSIIIPSFNRLWSLPAAVASCRSLPNSEIIVVDDGSTDGTSDWLAANRDLRVIRQHNQGKPAAVNAGVAAATGRYVRFLDSDDLLLVPAAEEQLQHALSTNADICVAGYLARYVGTGKDIAHPWQDCGDFLAQQLGECDSSHYSAFLFRRNFLTDVRHRPEYAFRDDRMFILECSLKAPVVAVWPELTLLHQHHERPRIQFQRGSIAVVTSWQEQRMFRTIVDRLDAMGELTPRRRAAVANNIWPLALRIAAHSRVEARDLLAWLTRLDPDFVIPRHGIHRLYRLLGFGFAQTVVNGARTVRDAGRRVAAAKAANKTSPPQHSPL